MSCAVDADRKGREPDVRAQARWGLRLMVRTDVSGRLRPLAPGIRPEFS